MIEELVEKMQEVYVGTPRNRSMMQAALLCINSVMETVRKQFIDAGFMTESEVNLTITKICTVYYPKSRTDQNLIMTLKTARSWIVSHGRLDNNTVLGQIDEALQEAEGKNG